MGETEQQRKEREHQEDLQRLRGFRPIDDDFMRGMFKKNLPLAQFVLRIITGKSDLVLTSCETQADLKLLQERGRFAWMRMVLITLARNTIWKFNEQTVEQIYIVQDIIQA